MQSIDHYHKAVRDLDIYGTPLEIATLITLVERSLDGDWFRAYEAEERFRRLTGKVQYIFIRAHTDDRQGVAIELRATHYGLAVFNLVPERGPLSIDDYNAIVIDFFLRFIDPAALDLELFSEISPDEICAKRGRRHSATIVVADC
ncbi:hypothetical protein [Candidatus Binatus sp.]|uniref:hypothetical protein n=1 Tax=Candidatus Binatus sp. TaxID=2811406 RepID=UPI003CC52815